MKPRILGRVSDPGKPGGRNEDIAGSTLHSAWVLDGATGLGDTPLLPALSDAEWLVTAYDECLKTEADCPRRDLRNMFEDIIAKVRHRFDAEKQREPLGRHELPSAGMVFVRVRPPVLEYARLGDCRAILKVPSDGRVLFTGDSPLRELDEAIVARMTQMRRDDPSLNHARLRQAVLGALRENRARLNTEGGYWVLGTDPAAARHIEIGTVPLSESRSLKGLLVSDGFYRLIDNFHVFPDDAALIDGALEGGLSAMLAELRAREQADPECEAYPRIKSADDATALLFEITD